jgi:spoIIIJ-associated protein
MESAEASGKTVEDALNNALAKLGARREEVELTVLDEGKKGLFGRGGRDAVVRVERLDRPREAAPANDIPDTRIPRTASEAAAATGARAGGRGRGGAPRRGAPAGPSGRQPQGGGGRPRGRGGSRPGLDIAEPKLTDADFLRPPRYDAEASPGDDDVVAAVLGGRGKDRTSTREPRERRRRPPEEQPKVEADINAEEVDFAAQVIDDILQILHLDAEITIREPVTPGDGLGSVLAVIDISGDDLGLLIGRRGDTLIAFQYLVNLIVSRRYPGRGGVTIDVEHYRHRREEQITSMAHRMADRVRQTGAPITLEPMPAADRRLVHLALADDPELMTNSIGEGENRKVVISTRK